MDVENELPNAADLEMEKSIILPSLRTTENNLGPKPVENQSPPTGPYEYVHKAFSKKDSPWQNWSKCDMAAAFEATCHPHPATCSNVKEVHNNHGIGNAMITSYSAVALECLNEKTDCAPILKDKLAENQLLTPHIFNF